MISRDELIALLRDPDTARLLADAVHAHDLREFRKRFGHSHHCWREADSAGASEYFPTGEWRDPNPGRNFNVKPGP